MNDFYEKNKDRLEKDKTKMRVAIMTNRKTVFMSNVSLSTPTSFDMNPEMTTACTDGKEIRLNPEFFDKLTPYEKIYLFAHEIMHKIFMHPDRGAKLLKLYPGMLELVQISCDIITNGTLNVAGIGSFIKGGIKVDSSGKCELNINNKNVCLEETHKMSMEEVFRELYKNIDKDDNNGDGGIEITQDGKSVGSIDQHKFNSLTPEEKKEMEREISRQITASKMRGTLPGWLQEVFEGMLRVNIDLKSELKEMIEPYLKSSQTYSRTNRRSQAIGVTMPGRYKEGLKMFISFDTSGSMGEKELKAGLGTLDSIFSQFEPGSVRANVMLHTTEVYKIYEEIESLNDLNNFKIQSGGTSHVDVFNKAEDMDAEILICYTDGFTELKENSNIRKILWVIIDNDKFVAPYGNVIHIKREDL